MKKVAIGKPVPDFEFMATDDQQIRLSDLLGKKVILYFYPKDNTPGCTTEGQDFRDHYEEFRALKTAIFGVSRDSLKSHENFKDKQCFPFDLISDQDEKLCKLFDVIREKSLYGRKYLGIERSTFVIDSKGILQKEYRDVKVNGHVVTVLADLKKSSKQ